MDKGTPASLKNSINNTDASRKVILTLLELHCKFLNFSANSGSGATINQENNIVIPINGICPNQPGGNNFIKDGIPQINKACAGVGTPMNESFCRISILNFAKRMAAKTDNDKPSHDHCPAPVFINKFLIKIPGNTPKLTTSAKESNSFPIGLETFNILALAPSRKSKTQAAQTNQAVGISGLVKEQIIPAHPHNRFPDVNAFGMCLVILTKGKSTKGVGNFLFP